MAGLHPFFMIICTTKKALSHALSGAANTHTPIGFVPTMGALHQGHISLINLSKQQAGFTVCSIFVNPTQFNDPADFDKYPVTIEQDIQLLSAASCNVLFLPSVAEMYPQGLHQLEHYNLGQLETLLEGAFRPGHFQGVCQVVNRLLDTVQPTHLFMGQKDYQQCMVIQHLLHLTGKNTQLVLGPTLRETSGLAMSSRNTRLSQQGHQNATAIYQSLQHIQQHLQNTPLPQLKQQAIQNLVNAGFHKIDYVEICEPATLRPLLQYQPGHKAVALVAAFLENVRLIDNTELVA
jgi:pantoate--beta-alanine ligase